MTAVLTASPSPSPSADTASQPPARRSGFRSDIEGLRAVAILGVVLFHAAVPHFSGGFVGVDVFFVISGFLITGQLVREYENTGSVRYGAFFARRAKRLLPAAGLVITTTMVATWFLAPVLSVFSASFDLLWSVFYIGNWRFIQQGNDYLAGTSDHNVALHFWSLAVEEQFYIVWPLLMIAVGIVATWRGLVPRRVLIAAIVPVSVVSFALGVWLTSSDPSLAYMATFTRAWQFGVGGLIAVLPIITSRWLRELAGWSGLLAVVFAIVTFDSTTAYPGTAALIPTFGTAAIIAARAPSLSRVLGNSVPTLIGRWSYSWYLWHWPVLVLVGMKYGPLTWQQNLGLMGVAFGLAGLTYHLVERPIMTSHLLKRRVSAAAAAGVISVVVATTAVLAVGTQAVHALGTGSSSPQAVSFEEVFGANSGVNSGAVTPSPLHARADIPKRPECLLDRTDEQPECLFGALGGIPVVLFGDSHAHQWLSALDEIAKARGWELHVITQSGCPVPDIAPRDGETARFSQSFCRQWRDQQIDRIIGMKPSAVIVSSMNFYIPQRDEILDAWSVSLDRLAASGAPLVYIRDTPYPKKSIPECISSELANWSACAFQLTDRVDPVITGSLQKVLPAIDIVDMNGYLCDGTTCPAVRNGILLYRDDSHLSNTAVVALTPALRKALDAVDVVAR